MKKQTAVEWLFEQLFDSFEKFNNGEYTFDEYLSQNLKVRKQALKMDKEQTIQFGYDILIQADEEQNGYVDVEECYNSTYNTDPDL